MAHGAWRSRSVFGGVAVAMALTLLGAATPAHAQSALARAISVLDKRGVFAEDSLYACMLDAYYQGISIQQATEDCATKLLEDDEKGIDGGPFGPLGPDTESFFDPYKISAACGAGDPSIAGGAQYGGGWGYYSWGGGENRKGLSREEAREAKAAAVEAAGKALQEWEEKDAEFRKAVIAEAKAQEEAEAKAARERAKAATAAALEAKKAAEEAEKKAKEDPNKVDPKKKHTAGDQTPCEEALDGAREILRECHRTQWQSFECQQLQAKMNHCPDPALIRVDPEQGYVCGQKIDTEELKNAWVAQCEERKRGVDPETNPCVPPEVEKPGRYVKTNPGLLCDDPAADYEPGSETCTATLKVDRPFGEPDLHALIVWGLNKLGGPIIVIHDDTQNPKPGPGGPKDF